MKKLLSSENKADLLVLFHKNPGLVDTVEGVAIRIGKRAGAIQQDVQELVGLGVLREKRVGNSLIISLDRQKDKEIQSELATSLKSLEVERE